MIRRLGRYELLEQVGSGGMAVVYRGRDTALDREVAVKLLHPHLASAPDSRARFSREARAVARLSHPGIVEIYDYAGDGAADSYLVTEFVRGCTLRVFAHEVGFGFPEIGALVGRALVDALVHAHSAGVIHRDLKPENVLVHEGDRPAVKLADFGIARILASDERMTMTGALVGSPHHMAPEIVEGREADARSDLFSLGTILYWLATGNFPFAAPNPTAILRRVLEADFEDPRAVDARVPDALADLVVRCLSLDPERRPSSAAEVREVLDRLLAESGLERAPDELVAFLRDPAAFKAAFPARAVVALSARGDEALAEGASARALAFYSRVLAIDPENAEIPAKLARLTRRRRLQRIALGAGAALAVAAATAAVVVLVPRPAIAPPASAAADARDAAQPGAGASTAHTGAGALPSEPEPEPEPVRDPEPRREGDPAAAPAREAHAGQRPRVPRGDASARQHESPGGPPASLSVHVRPYAQRALLDGIEVARGEQLVRFSIPPGRPHVIQLEHACCAPFVREITAEEAQRIVELRVPLEPRPARLRVEGDPATRVYVDGKLIGTAGESQRAAFAIPVPSGAESPYEAPARIGLEAAGAATRDVQVKLRAGGEVIVAAPTPAPQPPPAFGGPQPAAAPPAAPHSDGAVKP
ncbi:serine/threonine-protein kinase [Anaeromyxobacter terrae]|uniref:serine/threonine-protein kinase n=1 Tax=Anaeromyxobacter terrae TaxID=2925406 RepID=UPI001F55D7B6|nr:serine/threonine-protein kinase [Anaeromyxobacter sp. SG22]